MFDNKCPTQPIFDYIEHWQQVVEKLFEIDDFCPSIKITQWKEADFGLKCCAEIPYKAMATKCDTIGEAQKFRTQKLAQERLESYPKYRGEKWEFIETATIEAVEQ